MLFITSLILIAIDQLSKYYIVQHLKGQEPLQIIKGFLSFYYVENKGAAFGILQEKRALFIIITIVVVLSLIMFLIKYGNKIPMSLKLSLVLILSGTIGNFIDRVRLHYVVDFISLNIFGYDFAVFNTADIFIVIGSILLIILVLLSDDKKLKKA